MGGKKRLFRNKSVSYSHKIYSKQDMLSEVKSDSGKSINEAKHESFQTKKRHIYKRILKIHHDFPPGIAMLLVFSAIICALYIVLASMFSFTIILGAVIQGAFSRVLNIIMILLISFMIYGVSKKKMWGYHLSLWIFSFVIINSVVSMFLIRQNVSGLMNVFVSLSFFFILMMNMMTLWYIKSKKDYFLHNYHPAHMSREDKTFVFGLTGLWFAFILTTGTLGNEFYMQTTQKTDVLIQELSTVNPYSAEDYCLQKIDDRDLCLLTAALMYEKVINSNILCKDISSQFYKYTCFKAMQGDFI